MTVTLLDPATQPKFANHLNRAPVIDARSGGSYVVTAQQSVTSMGLYDPVSGLPMTTTVWGYGTDAPAAPDPHHPGMGTAGYGGPTFLTSSNVPIQVKWANALPTDLPGGHLLPLDMSILMDHMGHGAGMAMDHTLIPTVVHLHGAHVAANSDGYPLNWVTQDPMVKGTTTQPEYYTYDNSQGAGTLWYHDHAMGATRLNIYAGLAGTYIVEDQNYRNLVAAGALPATLGVFDTPLLIQDKSFTSDGQLYFPGGHADDPIPGTYDPLTGLWETVADGLPADYLDRGGMYPTAMPEFFGDFIVVNGQVTPHTHVEQSDYVYRLVNGSDSRFYVLKLDNADVKVTLIGSDGGILPTAHVIMDGDGVQEAGEQIVLAPGDRVELLLNFSHLAVGELVHLLNVGPAFEPFKGLNADGSLNIATAATTDDSTGQIMEFRVRDTLGSASEFHSTITGGMVLNSAYSVIDSSSVDRTRRIGLFEGEDQYGRIHPLLGLAEDSYGVDGQIIKAGPVSWELPVSEAPLLGDTEVWEVFNNTEDAHPLHLHLVQFQVLGRFLISPTDLDGDGYLNDLGDQIPLYPEDLGNQDTLWVGPGEALKLIATWDRPGSYVYHCHILSHEDHTMMRPIEVINTVTGNALANSMNGSSDIDRFTGNKGNDVLRGGDGNDIFVATVKDGNDRYYGDLGSDVIDCSALTAAVLVKLQTGTGASSFGTANGSQMGDDRLYSIENVIGGAGNDDIWGNVLDNFLSGGLGRDVIRGLGGNDRIMGGAGDDRLTGGAGTDAFLYYRDPGQNAFHLGRDVITDFDAISLQHDVLEIDNRLFGSFDDMMAAHAMQQKGSNVVITFDADSSITLLGVSMHDLVVHSATDFLFA